MTVPISLQPAGYAKTIAEIRQALEARMKNATNRLPLTPTFHRGAPNPDALPNNECDIWLDYERIYPDTDLVARITFLVSEWRLHIVVQDEGQDLFGTESDRGLQVFGAALQSLTETQADVSLDSSIEWQEDPTVDHGRGMAGDRRIEFFDILLKLHHEGEWIREIP